MEKVKFLKWATENDYNLADESERKAAKAEYASLGKSGSKRNKRTPTAILLRGDEVVKVWVKCGSTRAARDAAMAYVVTTDFANAAEYTLVSDEGVNIGAELSDDK